MGNIVFILVLALMLATLLVLLLGVGNMARGGEGSERRSNKMMRLRVVLQGLAVLLLGILFYLGQK